LGDKKGGGGGVGGVDYINCVTIMCLIDAGPDGAGTGPLRFCSTDRYLAICMPSNLGHATISTPRALVLRISIRIRLCRVRLYPKRRHACCSQQIRSRFNFVMCSLCRRCVDRCTRVPTHSQSL